MNPIFKIRISRSTLFTESFFLASDSLKQCAGAPSLPIRFLARDPGRDAIFQHIQR